MKSPELINIEQCCKLLKTSRPTFNERRKVTHLTELVRGRSIYFKKAEILNKLYVNAFDVQATVDFVLINPNFDISHILIDEFTIDLRKIRELDPYGIISLLCYVTSKVKLGQNVFFVGADNLISLQLIAVGFFKELTRKYSNLTHWDRASIDKLEPTTKAVEQIFLPLKEITIKGQDRLVLDELLLSLLQKGFTETQAGYIGWIIGELADNALTHARGPCYIMFSKYQNNGGTPFLEFAVGDVGVGIHKSLQTNKKYSHLNDKQAFLKAFQSQVSSWPDSAQRGKGLCDLLTIALGNGGWLKADANELGLFFNFTANQRLVEFNKPLTEIKGTRYSIILFEKNFKGSTREEIDSFISAEIEKYE